MKECILPTFKHFIQVFFPLSHCLFSPAPFKVPIVRGGSDVMGGLNTWELFGPHIAPCLDEAQAGPLGSGS